jgi:hypothetical protein
LKTLLTEKELCRAIHDHKLAIKFSRSAMSLASNKRAIKALVSLVLAVAIIFSIEKKFLVNEARGSTISNYQHISWSDKILLLVDDFEGLPTDSAALVQAGFFGFGSGKIMTDASQADDHPMASKTSMRVIWDSTYNYGGWGKGVGKNFDLDAATDYVNFRVYAPKSNGGEECLKVMLEEDDNYDGVLEQEQDDSWIYRVKITPKDEWQFISIPVKDFTDGNAGGDSIININRKGGLHTVIFSFEQTEQFRKNYKWYFDFICFTKGKPNY